MLIDLAKDGCAEPLRTELSPNEKEAMIRSALASQAYEGLLFAYEDAVRIFDEVMREPLIDIA